MRAAASKLRGGGRAAVEGKEGHGRIVIIFEQMAPGRRKTGQVYLQVGSQVGAQVVFVCSTW